MKHAAFALALLLSACGSRAGLSPSDEGSDRGEPSARVPFPSIAEVTAIPAHELLQPVRPREREYGDDSDQCELAVPSLDAALARVQADVLAQPAEDRPFLRYVSAAFALSTYCRMDTAINAVADALPLLLNSLSLSESVASAQLVPGDEALFRIDLRQMGWDRSIQSDGLEHADGWEALSANAQAVALRGPEADALQDLIGTRTPLLHAHEFARSALTASVYYALLDAPESLVELRRTLGIPPDLDAEPNAYWRAIVTRSTVSRQDRVLLRYRAPADGPLFWHTLERLPDTALTNALVDPLAREGDESSVMYTLPNGLLAYYLAGPDGARLDESRVLLDTAQSDFVPRTAPSCMRCHSDGGVMPARDQLRSYAATDPNGRFSARELALLAEVYPPQEELDALIEADRLRVGDAQGRVGVRGPSVAGLLDELVRTHDRDVAPALAAAELFVSPADLERRRAELPGPLRVLVSLGSLDRRSFDDTYREALCAMSRAARNQPIDCP